MTYFSSGLVITWKPNRVKWSCEKGRYFHRVLEQIASNELLKWHSGNTGTARIVRPPNLCWQNGKLRSGNVELLCTSQNHLHRVHVDQSDWCVMTHAATLPMCCLQHPSFVTGPFTLTHPRDWNPLMSMDHIRGKVESFMSSSFIIGV